MSWLRSYTREGAAQIRVCFNGFQVEPYYDYVEIRDASERIVQVLTGDLGESASFCSARVEGATVKVRFFTDASVVSRGFRVYRVESKRAHPVEARFPGQWLERETIVKDATTQTTVYAGLHNNWHRFYDPETARYITPDPLGLRAGMNPFAYVDGDPVTFVDLEGTHPVLANLLRRFGPPLLNILKTFGKRAHRWTKGLTKGKVTNNVSVPNKCSSTAPPGSFQRTHGLSGNRASQHVANLAQSMKEKGWQGDPIVVFEHNGYRYLLDGHHRMQAAMRAGLKEIPYKSISESELARYNYKSVNDLVNAWSEAGSIKLR